MNESLILIGAGVTGVALGVFFFGGLSWTVRNALASPRPARWFLGSLLLRMSVTLAGFYFVSGAHWEHLLACLLGFLAARFAVTRLTRLSTQSAGASASKVSHAP